MSPGAVEYLLRGSGCAEHEHAGEASARGGGRTADAVELHGRRRGEGAGRRVGRRGPADGRRAGRCHSHRGGGAGGVRAAGHPTQIDLRTGEAVPLGSRPRNFDSRDERVAQALAAEPDATEERKAEIRQKAQGKRKPVAYYDLTFSPVKSGSVYWAALLETGRDAEAANVVEAHRAAVAAAMAYVEEQIAYVRSGYHGKTASGQSVGVYEQASGLVVDPLGPLDQPRAATPAAQPRDGAQPGGDDLRRGDPGAGQPRASSRSSRPPTRSTRRCSRRRSSPPTGWCSRPARTARRARSSGSARSCWPRRPPAPQTSPMRQDELVAAVRAGPRAGTGPGRARRIHRRRVAGDPPAQELRGGAAPSGVELGRSRCASELAAEVAAADAAGARRRARRAPRAAGLRDARPRAGAARGAADGAGALRHLGRREPGRGDRRRAGPHPGGHRGAAGPGGRGAAPRATGTGS